MKGIDRVPLHDFSHEPLMGDAVERLLGHAKVPGQ